LLHESQDRIRSIALVHETLYQSGNLADVDLGEYARTLADALLASYAFLDGRVSLIVDVEPVHLAIERVVPCGLVLNELLSNALKHGFPDGRQGSITLTVRAQDNAACLVRVADDGVGFDSETEKPQSLGLRLIEALAGQLDGKFEFMPLHPT